MSWLFFGSKKARGKTILIVDVENESVGCALVYVSKKAPPKVFAEHRVHLPLLTAVHSDLLREHVVRATHEAIMHTSAVASRIRNHTNTATLGDVSEAYVFLSAPWSSLRHVGSRLEWHHEPDIARALSAEIGEFFGTIPVSYFASATAIAAVTNMLFTTPPHILIAHITGEVSQLYTLRSQPNKKTRSLTAGATIPFGSRAATRTLRTHGGLSHSEAESALRLLSAAQSPVSERYEEPLGVLLDEYGNHFGTVAKDMHAHDVGGVVVVSDSRVGPWLARALSEHDAVTEAISDAAFVQTIHTHHLLPYVAAHAPQPDLLLLIESIFAHGKYRGV